MCAKPCKQPLGVVLVCPRFEAVTKKPPVE